MDDQNKENNIRAGSRSLANTRPDLLDEWDFDKNHEDPNEITYGSKKKVWWKCSKGHSWKAAIQHRTKTNGTNCPYCVGSLVTKDKSLQTLYPILAQQFDIEENRTTPDKVHANSNKKYWWKCEQADDHRWQAKPNDRVKKPGCPFCSGRRASKDDNFAVTHPDLLEQWDYAKNEETSPQSLTKSSTKRVWWKCRKAEDHSWKASINQRTTRQADCPFCSGRKICRSNCLVTTHPQILEEWDYSKNTISPSKITYASHKKVWWICNKGHSWQAPPYSRTSGKGCPECNISKGEDRIRCILEKLGIDYQREYQLKGLARKRFDFAVFISDQIRLIEYHGIQHYEPISWSKNISAKANMRNIQKRDQEKRSFAKAKGLDLLEIPYWSFDDIETIISKFLGIM